jgi:hypothetical protein
VTHQTIQLIVTAISATATVLAVLVALFGPEWRERRKRPQLSLSFDEQRDVVPVRPAGEAKWVYARPRVHNRQGRRTAEDVEAVVTSIQREPPAPSEGLLEGRALRWSDVDAPKVSVAPGAYRQPPKPGPKAPPKPKPGPKREPPSARTAANPRAGPFSR